MSPNGYSTYIHPRSLRNHVERSLAPVAEKLASLNDGPEDKLAEDALRVQVETLTLTGREIQPHIPDFMLKAWGPQILNEQKWDGAQASFNEDGVATEIRATRHGQTYCKEVEADGTTVWSNGQILVRESAQGQLSGTIACRPHR